MVVSMAVFGIGQKLVIGDISVDKNFIETYKKILLAAAKKYFGEWVQYNENERIVDAIIRGEIKNMINFGHAFCPCRTEKIREHICPCEPAKKELEEQGICHCKLFINPRVYKA